MEFLKAFGVVLLIPILGGVALLLIAGGGDGEFEQSGIVRIDQPRELVYEWLAEPEHRTKWVEGLTSCRSEGRDIDVGQRLAEVVTDEDGRHERTVEVVAADYGDLLTLRFTEPGRTIEVRYSLVVHKSSRRTRVDVTTSGVLEGWWARLLEPVLAARIAEQVELDLDRLAEAIRGA